MGSRAPSTLMAGQWGHRMQEVQRGADCARCDTESNRPGSRTERHRRRSHRRLHRRRRVV